MWQAHDTGHAPSSPPTGRDKGEDTQVDITGPKLIFYKYY